MKSAWSGQKTLVTLVSALTHVAKIAEMNFAKYAINCSRKEKDVSNALTIAQVSLRIFSINII